MLTCFEIKCYWQCSCTQRIQSDLLVTISTWTLRLAAQHNACASESLTWETSSMKPLNYNFLKILRLFFRGTLQQWMQDLDLHVTEPSNALPFSRLCLNPLCLSSYGCASLAPWFLDPFCWENWRDNCRANMLWYPGTFSSVYRRLVSLQSYLCAEEWPWILSRVRKVRSSKCLGWT